MLPRLFFVLIRQQRLGFLRMPTFGNDLAMFIATIYP